MLKKENRLTKNNDFDRVFKKGRSSYDKIIGVKVFFTKTELNRFGILVSTKVDKRAVGRNKIKRRIREIIRQEVEKMKTGQDVVIITLPAIKEKSYKEIKDSLVNNFKKLRIYS